MYLNAGMDRLGWYVSRLAAMSPGEVLHRMRELRRKRQLSAWSHGWAPFEDARLANPEAFSFLKERLSTLPGQAVENWLTNPFHLGRDWRRAYPLQGEKGVSFWHVDPVSNLSWPGTDAGAFDAQVRLTSAAPSGRRPYGDVKFVWEPNRLQVLQPLSSNIARGAIHSEIALTQLLSSWMECNPPFRGVNWFSGIEIALRICSAFFAASVCNDKNIRNRLSAFVAAHAYWLSLLPSLYSSANNHRIAEGLGLYLAGLMLEKNRNSTNWQQEGRRILESECLLQILEDGSGAEQSPTYQAFSMELIGFGLFVAKFLDNPFPRTISERLLRGARFLSSLQSETGEVPSIGDDDEGRVLTNPAVGEPFYAASVCRSISVLCGDDSIPGHAPGYFREFVFGCAPGSSVLHQDVIEQFKEGGYTVVREFIGGRNIHLVFDHGPLGYLKLAAHGHSDALAIWLSVDGVPVFADAGTWLYHSGEAMRQVIRRSQFHNTLSLPGFSQSEPSAAFSWRNKAQAQLSGPSNLDFGGWKIAASHDGYKKRKGMIHHRAIERRANGFAILDSVEGTQKSELVQICFLCGAGTGAHLSGGKIVLTRDQGSEQLALARLTPPAGFDVNLFDGDIHPDYAFLSPSFGKRVSAARIVLEGEAGHKPSESLIEFSWST